MEAWYVAKTKPAKEKRVETYITGKWNLEVFLPIIRRPSDNKSVFEPLFPTYLFCRIDAQSAVWPDIRWVPGLCYFLSAGQQLVPVSDEIITHLKQRVSWWNDGGYVPRFRSGERVLISVGPFSGMEGVFKRYLPARQRCFVLLEFLGHANKVEVPVEILRADIRCRGLALAA